MPVNEQAVDAITIGNVKTIAEVGSHSMGLAMQNAVALQQAATANMLAFQQSMNTMLVAATGQVVNLLSGVDPTESVSVQKTLTGNDLAQVLAMLGASIASGQQNQKGAGNTPPVTP